MKKIKSIALKLWQDESGQGTAEYVLILVGIVAVGMLFRKEIVKIVESKIAEIGSRIQGFQ